VSHDPAAAAPGPPPPHPAQGHRRFGQHGCAPSSRRRSPCTRSKRAAGWRRHLRAGPGFSGGAGTRRLCTLPAVRRGAAPDLRCPPSAPLPRAAGGRPGSRPGSSHAWSAGCFWERWAVRTRREKKVIDAVSVRCRATELEARLDGLLAHLRRERAHLFTFLSEPGIPATNWRGEQALRPAVVNRKVWGVNRDLSGARTEEMVGSVVRTCRQQARDPHAMITALLRSPVPMVAPCSHPPSLTASLRGGKQRPCCGTPSAPGEEGLLLPRSRSAAGLRRWAAERSAGRPEHDDHHGDAT
jgi:hypothetical protein